jgi:hypothetical protein
MSYSVHEEMGYLAATIEGPWVLTSFTLALTSVAEHAHESGHRGVLLDLREVGPPIWHFERFELGMRAADAFAGLAVGVVLPSYGANRLAVATAASAGANVFADIDSARVIAWLLRELAGPHVSAER